MLIDSNILVFSLNTQSTKCKIARDFLLELPKFYIAQQNIFETIRVITHHRYPNPFSIDKAISSVKRVSDSGTVIFPTSETPEIAFQLMKKYKVTGTEVFDCYLVATALSHNIKRIASDNLKHLKKYHEVEVLSPFTK